MTNLEFRSWVLALCPTNESYARHLAAQKLKKSKRSIDGYFRRKNPDPIPDNVAEMCRLISELGKVFDG